MFQYPGTLIFQWNNCILKEVFANAFPAGTLC